MNRHGEQSDVLLTQLAVSGRIIAAFGERTAATIGLGCAAAAMIGLAFATQGWQAYAYMAVGALGAVARPALSGMLSRRVDASRQGALQGGLASLSSVAALAGLLIASQLFAYGATIKFAGVAFLVSGTLMTAASLIIALRVSAHPGLQAGAEAH